jgi:hypothetical protein
MDLVSKTGAQSGPVVRQLLATNTLGVR